MHDFQCRGVQGIAAEVAQKISVLFEDDHRGAGSSQQQAQHHPGRPSTGNAAPN